MNTNVYNYLKKHSPKSACNIDKLIISAYLSINNLKVKNSKLLLNHVISEGSTNREKSDLQDFITVLTNSSTIFNLENLIEIFEFVLSPSHKTVNGAIYTPAYIRSFILDKLVSESLLSISNITGCDPACGCGGFLLTFSYLVKKLSGRSYFEIYKHQVYGVDITKYSIVRSKLLLSIPRMKSST